MARLLDRLYAYDEVATSPLLRELAVTLTVPTGTSTSGHPYLQPSVWHRFRDWVPHLFGEGRAVLAGLERLTALIGEAGAAADEVAVAKSAAAVVAQVVRTAAITAPSDLWLLRYVVDAIGALGLASRLASDEGLDPRRTDARAEELEIDLRFLLGRGYLVRVGPHAYRLAPHPLARRLMSDLPRLPESRPSDFAASWAAAARGEAPLYRAHMLAVAEETEPPSTRWPGLWMASPEEVAVGYALVPLLVGLKAAARSDVLAEQDRLSPEDVLPHDEDLSRAAWRILRAAAVVDDDGALGELGRRVLERGPGPMGIIEAYHPYMARLVDVLTKGRGEVWVERSANVAASQVANQKSFERANDALDRFCEDTGFTYDTFIEHAMGRGEAIRQRRARDGDDVRFIGADLEDAAVDAAEAERAAGNLPADTLFIRNADIARPETLLEPLARAGVNPAGAVMMVGNGFHEARVVDDDAMTEVFAGYARAGLVLLFTEETGLAVDDLLETAWNTYHAGFKYVHERSGQGLRPAVKRPGSGLEGKLPASWAECAERGGYLRLDKYCVRSRTVYPYPTASGHNPAISVTHFLVPAALAAEMGLDDGPLD